MGVRLKGSRPTGWNVRLAAGISWNCSVLMIWFGLVS